MEKQDIIKGIESFCTKIDGSAKKGYYADVARSSLLSDNRTTANKVWTQSEYIIAYIDERKDVPQSLQDYLNGFRQIIGEKRIKNGEYLKKPQYLILQEGSDNWGFYDGSLTKIGDTKYIEDFLAKKQYTKEMLGKGFPLQRIYYGSPGCGKSHYVEKLIKDRHTPDKFVIRTTFHPDSDYNSFVGAYKPKMNGEKIEYGYCPQAFTKAYITAYKNPTEQVFLIIEEINRGNCAQIFGDIFQLLDRTEGFSTYSIDADEDLKAYLEKEFEGSDKDGIKDGKLKLPANLSIIATMNTSDQSLFPMDSAFKRRWDWVYMPIDTTNTESAKYNILIDDGTNVYTYSWHKFLDKINPIIRDVTKSEDKQLGNFFIRDSISATEFISKVMFFLWYEICKEEFGTKNNFFRTEEDKEFSFNDLYSGRGISLLVSFMKRWEVDRKVEKKEKVEPQAEEPAEDATDDEQAD